MNTFWKSAFLELPLKAQYVLGYLGYHDGSGRIEPIYFNGKRFAESEGEPMIMFWKFIEGYIAPTENEINAFKTKKNQIFETLDKIGV